MYFKQRWDFIVFWSLKIFESTPMFKKSRSIKIQFYWFIRYLSFSSIIKIGTVRNEFTIHLSKTTNNRKITTRQENNRTNNRSLKNTTKKISVLSTLSPNPLNVSREIKIFAQKQVKERKSRAFYSFLCYFVPFISLTFAVTYE